MTKQEIEADSSEYFKWRSLVKEVYPLICSDDSDNCDEIIQLDLDALQGCDKDGIYDAVINNFPRGAKLLKGALKKPHCILRFKPAHDMPYTNSFQIKANCMTRLLRIRGIATKISEIMVEYQYTEFTCFLCKTTAQYRCDNRTRHDTRYCTKHGCNGIMDKDKQVTINVQRIEITEDSALMNPNEQPNRMMCEFHPSNDPNDYISNNIEGKLIEIVGIVKIVDAQMVLEINNYAVVDDIQITEEDIKQQDIVLKNPNLIAELSQSIAYNIEGYNNIKYIILLNSILLNPEGKNYNGFIFILSSHGYGKTTLINCFEPFLPKITLISAYTATEAGLLGVTEYNQKSKRWETRAGKFVMANNGLIVIDEFDKIHKNNMRIYHTALSEGKVQKINAASTDKKINISGILLANPQNLKLDKERIAREQITIPWSIMDRCGWWVTLDYSKDVKRDERKLRKIIDIHSGIPTKVKPTYNINPTFVKKLIYRINQAPNPLMDAEMQLYSHDKIIEITSEFGEIEQNPRFPEHFMVMVRKHAKWFLRERVLKHDIDVVSELYKEEMFSKINKILTKNEGINKVVEDIVTLRKHRQVNSRLDMYLFIEDNLKEIWQKEPETTIMLSMITEWVEQKGFSLKVEKEIISRLTSEGILINIAPDKYKIQGSLIS